MTRALPSWVCILSLTAAAASANTYQREEDRLTSLLRQQPDAVAADMATEEAAQLLDDAGRKMAALSEHLNGALAAAIAELSTAEEAWTAQTDDLVTTLAGELDAAAAYVDARAAYNRFLSALPNTLAIGRASSQMRSAAREGLELLHDGCSDVAQIAHLLGRTQSSNAALVEQVNGLNADCAKQADRLTALSEGATRTEQAADDRRSGLQQHWDAEVSKLAVNTSVAENADWLYVDVAAVEAEYGAMKAKLASLKAKASDYYTRLLAPLMARRYVMMLKNVTRKHRARLDLMPEDFSHRWLFANEVEAAERFIDLYDARLAAYDDDAAADLHAWRVDDVDFYLSISTEPTEQCQEARSIQTMHPRTTEAEQVYIRFMEECI